MSYEEQAKRYGMSLEDLLEMHKENSQWWENELVKEMEEKQSDN